MTGNDLKTALECVNGYLRVDPSDGGPDSAADSLRYQAAGEALAKELERLGHKIESGVIHLTYVSHVKVFRVVS